jgi:prepilin-type N-terminal cleavage/methylation domain-containing protein
MSEEDDRRAGVEIRGFTLLELSVVLVIIAVILSGALAMFIGSVQASQFNTTVKRMDAIDKALLNYAAANSRIPCPSDLTQIASGANYGVEAANTGSCWSGTPAANFKAASNTVEGGVPVRALALPDDYMYDGWGRKLRYAVDPTYTAASSLPVAASCSLTVTPNASAIRVNDSTGASRTTMAAYVLISHGANGHGAYTSNGVTVNAGSSSANELTNCHCNSSGVATGTYTPTYVQKLPQYDSGETGVAAYYFDDIVSFREGWQMQAPDYALNTTASCAQYIYVSDQTNSRVEQFNTSGTYLMGIGAGYQGVGGSVGSAGSLNGQFYQQFGVAADASGNLYVADRLNNRVQKFNSSGTWLMTIPLDCANNATPAACNASASNGELNEPYAVAVDPSGNIWVADTGNIRAQKFNSAGSYLLTIGKPNGTANGEFKNFGNTPFGIATDASGNVYAMDVGNCRVEKFNSSGSFLMGIGAGYNGISGAIGSCGSGNGQFSSSSNPSNNIAINQSTGDIWVSDESNTRVQKFNSSGTFLFSVGNWGGCDGQFEGVTGITVDPSGNLWTTDEDNDCAQEFNSSGTFITTFGSEGTANGTWNGTNGIVFVGSR